MSTLKLPILTNNFKVTIQLMGGLANQLFQIAAVLNYSKKYGHKSIFPTNVCDIGCTKRDIYWKYLNTTNLLTIEDLDYNDFYIRYSVNKEFAYNEFPYIENNVLLDGYYQTYQYVDLIRDDLIKLLLSNKEVNKKIDEIYKKVIKKYNTEDLISVHIRRNDYLKYSHIHTNLGMDYYIQAVNKISNNKNPIIVFTDDYNWCKKNFPKYFKNCLYFISEEGLADYEELILMSKIKYNIIANSSFSWWSAYINNNKDKIVIAPSRWFASNNIYINWDCLYYPGWIVI